MKERSQARWAVVLGAAAILSACGGGGGDAPSPPPPAPVPLPPNTVVVDTTTSASGGSSSVPASTLEATVDGPAFALTATNTVEVCKFGTWTQQLRGGSMINVTMTALAPVELAPRAGVGVDAFGTTVAVPPTTQCDTHTLPAGTYQLRYRVRLDASSAVLADYVFAVRWRVRTPS